MSVLLVAANSDGLSISYGASTPPISGYPFSVGMWVNLAAVGTSNRTLFKIDTPGASTDNFRISMDTTERLQIVADDGAETALSLTTSLVAGSWTYVVGRFISATNRRIAQLTPAGVAEHAQSTVNRTPSFPGLDAYTLGHGGGTLFWDGMIAEYWLARADIMPGGIQLDDALLRQLAFEGPFSTHIVKDLIDYRSFRRSVTNRAAEENEVYMRSTAGLLPWGFIGGPDIGPHPPLYPSYKGPLGVLRQKYRLPSDITVITGTLAVTEVKDTAAFSGFVGVSGSLAVTEVKDTAAFSGFVGVSGSLAVTEVKDTAAFVGDVIVSGTLAVTEAQDTAAFAGDVITDLTGTLATTEAKDTAAFVGSVLISGTLATTEAGDVAAFVGFVGVSGLLVVTEAQDTAAFSGFVGVSGTLAITEAKDTAVFAGDVIVSGTLAVTEAQDIAAFFVDTGLNGTLDTTEAPDIAAFNGLLVSIIVVVIDAVEAADSAKFNGYYDVWVASPPLLSPWTPILEPTSIWTPIPEPTSIWTPIPESVKEFA